MKKIHTQQLANFLENGLFYEPYTDMAKLMPQFRRLDSPIKILYGETHDKYGLTVDSLKYYFIVHYLKKVLEGCGYQVEADILLGDVSSIRNKLVNNKEEILTQSRHNLELINKILQVYHLELNVKLMSDIVQQNDYQQRRDSLTEIFQQDKSVQEILPKTVLKNRITQEKETSYLYAREEVALILPYDIKVGPPREIHYDSIAQKTASNFGLKGPIGLYVKPTYPLGENFAFFLTNKEIEEFGLTPYKAGSNQLQNHRVILEQTSLGRMKQLIESSYIPSHPSAANPVRDLYSITDMARNLLENNQSMLDFSAVDVNSDFKSKILAQYKQHVLEPLELKENI